MPTDVSYFLSSDLNRNKLDDIFVCLAVDGSVISQIGRGLLVFIGISAKDGKKDTAYM